MPKYNALDRGQSNPGALELVLSMKSLEDAEQLVGVFHVKTNAVVSNEEHGVGAVLVGASDVNVSLHACAGELYGIPNDIDESQSQHWAISVADRQRINLPDDATPLRGLSEF